MTAPVTPLPRWVRVALLGVLLGIGFWRCTAEPERQWQKFGQPYTETEFQRDKAECTREGKLDVGCMRARGWVAVSPDRPASSSPEPPKQPRIPGY